MKNLKVLKFFKGRKGIISRLPSGKIVLVNRKSCVMPHANEKWLCRVDFEKENFVVVTPLAKEVLVKSVYKCGHIEVKRVSVSEVSLSNVKLVGGDAVVEYYYPFKCPECSKEEEEELKRAVEEELNEFFKKAKKIIEKITPKPEFTEQFPKPTWQEDAKRFIMEAVEKGQKITEIDDIPAYGWYEEYPTYFTNTEKVIKTVAYEYKGVTVPMWVFIDGRAENGINEFKLWEWIKTLPEDHELRRKAEAEENAVRQYYKKKDELLRKWEEENGVYLKMLFELYQSMSYDAKCEFSDDYLSNGREVYESILAWMDDSECSKEEDAIARKTVEEEIQKLEEEYNEWRENFFSKGLELKKCFEFDFYEDVEPLVTVDRPVAAAIAMKTVEAEVVQKLKDKYSIDEVEDLYYTDLEKYVEFYKEFMNAVKEEVQKLIDDGFVPVIVRNVEERQKYVVDENIGYQLRGEYAFVKFFLYRSM